MIYELIDIAIPKEIVRLVVILLFITSLYIAYRVTRVFDMLEGAIKRAEADRKKAMGQTYDTIRRFNDRAQLEAEDTSEVV